MKKILVIQGGVAGQKGTQPSWLTASWMAGMYILKTGSREEAEELCKREPLVAGGFAKYKLVGLQVANRENNYLL